MLANNLLVYGNLSLGLNEPRERIIRVICLVLDAVIKCGGPNDPKMGKLDSLFLRLLKDIKEIFLCVCYVCYENI